MKAILQKVNQDEEAEGFVPVEGTRENSRRTSRWREHKNNDNEDDPGSWKQNGEDTRNAYQRPRTKGQVEMNDTLEGINSGITQAAERISNLEDRMVEITAAEENTGKKKKKGGGGGMKIV